MQAAAPGGLPASLDAPAAPQVPSCIPAGSQGAAAGAPERQQHGCCGVSWRQQWPGKGQAPEGCRPGGAGGALQSHVPAAHRPAAASDRGRRVPALSLAVKRLQRFFCTMYSAKLCIARHVIPRSTAISAWHCNIQCCPRAGKCLQGTGMWVCHAQQACMGKGEMHAAPNTWVSLAGEAHWRACLAAYRIAEDTEQQ